MANMKKSHIGKIKLMFAAVLGALLMLLALQNMAQVDLEILFWTIHARRVVVIAFAFIVGFTIGWLVRGFRRA